MPSDAVGELRRLPIIHDLETVTDLPAVLGALEDAAECSRGWNEAVAAASQAVFPGSTTPLDT